MLELKDIRKKYKVGEIETKALSGISLSFREKEFVAILGPSGSGKTTALNIIGGLDRYDSGDLIIKGKHTKDFRDKDWDAYRNNSIGFVFQSYNLISHLSIVANVEMAMTLSGVGANEKRRRAVEALKEVGLKEHLHKKPNQLSGGQMQRVAIARALANKPEILLCDEPTGALDSETSVQIMDLIERLSMDRLVIMVTHNAKIANRYANRVIEFEDGKIISDSHPYENNIKKDEFDLKHTSMSFLTALNLSFNNILTKKGRTFLTAFASSIGIIGIAIILSLSSGFQVKINEFQKDAMSEFPIMITQQAVDMDEEKMQEFVLENSSKGKEEALDVDEVYPFDPEENTFEHKNNLSDDYIEYVKDMDTEICESIGLVHTISLNLVGKKDGEYINASFVAQRSDSGERSAQISSMNSIGLSTYPTKLENPGLDSKEKIKGEEENKNFLERGYDLLDGKFPTEPTDLVLVIDSKNKVDYLALENIGIKAENEESVKFEDILGTELKLISNNDFYTKTEIGSFAPNQDLEEIYKGEDNITLTVTGIIREKPDKAIGLLKGGIAYSDELTQLVFENSVESEIVKAQKESDKNVFTMTDLTADMKENMLLSIGGDTTPAMITIFPRDFESKDKVTEYLDKYNQDKEDKEKVVYSDLAESISKMTSGIMDGITVVLIAFASISLVVSLIMIAIIIYISVLERTKEIGVLRALGARKKDITRVFDAETTILGVFSGALGVFIAWALTFPINIIIEKMTNLPNVAQLQLVHAAALVMISTVLTILGGHIPAKMASRKDAVEALRTE